MVPLPTPATLLRILRFALGIRCSSLRVTGQVASERDDRAHKALAIPRRRIDPTVANQCNEVDEQFRRIPAISGVTPADRSQSLRTAHPPFSHREPNRAGLGVGRNRFESLQRGTAGRSAARGQFCVVVSVDLESCCGDGLEGVERMRGECPAGRGVRPSPSCCAGSPLVRAVPCGASRRSSGLREGAGRSRQSVRRGGAAGGAVCGWLGWVEGA